MSKGEIEMVNIRKLESDLWESADLLRAGSKLTSNQYCMPVLGLIFLRYAYSRFKLMEAEILKNRDCAQWPGAASGSQRLCVQKRPVSPQGSTV